jgi:hypothetical protein
MLSKYLYLQSRHNNIIWRNILNHQFLLSASPFYFSLNLRPYYVLLIFLLITLTGVRRITDVRHEV